MAKQERKHVTMLEIAERLGMSKTTVSFVLSGQARQRHVADETARQVRELAQELGYIPNHWARSLRRRRTGVVSVLFTNLNMNWADGIMRGISSVFQPAGYTSFVGVDWDDISRLKQELSLVLQRRDEGVICHSFPDAVQEFSEVMQKGVPLVFVSDIPEGFVNKPGINAVVWDDASPVKLAVRHLIETGRRRIAFVGVRHGGASDLRRFQAFKQTMTEAGLPLKKERIIWAPLEFSAPEDYLEPLFVGGMDGPDAVFALNDAIAVHLLALFEAKGVRVPDDVAVAGVGDQLVAFHVGLTTVHEPLEELGRQAAEVLLELIEDPGKAPINRIVSCNELVVRKTT